MISSKNENEYRYEFDMLFQDIFEVTAIESV